VVGLDRLAAIHLNDSKTPRGSRVDRHEHIGKGKIGLPAFRFIMRDRRFRKIPKVLETPKDKDLREDVVNLKTLRRLAATRDASHAVSFSAERSAVEESRDIISKAARRDRSTSLGMTARS